MKTCGKVALQYMGMRSWDGDKVNSFSKAMKCPIKVDAIEGDETERLTLVHFSVFGPRQYNYACLVCSAYKCSHQKENNTSSNQPMRL